MTVRVGAQMGRTEFGRLVVLHRHGAGLTQEQLADRAGLSVRGVRYLERGERVPYPDTVSRLAAALSLPDDARRAMSLAAAAARGGVGEGVLPEPFPSPDDVVGRSADIDALAALLRGGARLVTLTGPGGVGKTTVAAALGRQIDREYTGGVRWTSLASVDDAGGVPRAVGRALGVPSASCADADLTLAEHLRGGSWLVVLDNMERVTDAATRLVDLLHRCPGLQFLVTSRIALRVRAELEYRLTPLGLSAAVEMFERRARSVDYRFAVTMDNADAVTAICRRLDGLPLALELAAARVRLFDAAEIDERLDQPLDLLTAGPHDAPERHRSLRAAIAWSHDLLPSPQRRLFRRMSVFVDGADLDAIGCVCAGSGTEPIDDLDGLVRASLVVRDAGIGASRYRLLDTIRAYASEQLAADPAELHHVRARHATYFTRVAADAGTLVEGPQQAEAMARLDADRHNIRVAIACLVQDGHAAEGLRAMTATWMYFYIRGYAVEGHRHLAALLDLPDATVPTELRAAGLLAISQLARAQGDLDSAAAEAAAAVTLYRHTRDTAGLAMALFGAGFIARVRRSDTEARTLLTDALAAARAVQDTYIIAASLHHLAMLELDAAGDRSAARRLLQESHCAYREMGFPRMIGLVLATLGSIEDPATNPIQAQTYFAESLRTLIDAGEPREIHFPLQGLADLAYATGQLERAVTLTAAAATYRASLLGRPIGPLLPGAGTWLNHARASLTPQRFATAWDAGEALGPHDALAEALAQPPRSS